MAKIVRRHVKSVDNDDHSKYSELNGFRSYEQSRGCGFLSFSWLTQWINVGCKGHLEPHQYPKLPDGDFDQFAATEFGIYMQRYRDPNYRTIWDRLIGKTRLCLVRVFRHSFIWLIVFTTFRDIFEIFNIYLLKYVMKQITPKTGHDIIMYILLSALIWLVQLADIYIDGHHHFYYKRMTCRVENLLFSFLFSRIITKDYIIDHATDEEKRKLEDMLDGYVVDENLTDENDGLSVMNLALFDISEIAWGLLKLVDLITVPLKITIVGTWLYTQIGPTALKTVTFIILITILMLLSECKSAKLVNRYVSKMDLRIFKTQTILEDLRHLRLLRWIPFAIKSILTSRTHELQICLKRTYLAAIGSWLGISLPSMLAIAVFLISIRDQSSKVNGVTLSASFSIPLLHTLSYFIKPFKELPSDISDHLETTVSCNRLESFVCRKILDNHIDTEYDLLSRRKNVVKNTGSGKSNSIRYDNDTKKQKGAIEQLCRSISSHMPYSILNCIDSFKYRLSSNSAKKTGTTDPIIVNFNDIGWQFQTSRSELSVHNEHIEVIEDYEFVVYMENATFTRGGKLNLRNINIKFKTGEVSLIIGPCGSGKSSLINAILGESTLVEGKSILSCNELKLPIGYVGQNPWISVGSVRDTILFGHVMNASLYNKVVRITELDVDFNSWNNGDLREVDEGGHNLSTGQRVRISLARCLYNQLINEDNIYSKRYSLFCLDDIFSVLDPSLGVRLFNGLFGKDGLLKNACVVLTVQPDMIRLISSACISLDYPSFAVYQMSNCTISAGAPVSDYLNLCFEPVEDECMSLDRHTCEDPGSLPDNSVPTTFRTTSLQPRGSIGRENYAWYLRKVGVRLVYLLLFLSIFAMLLDIGSELVITRWTSLGDGKACKISTNEIAENKLEDIKMIENQCYNEDAKNKLNHLYMYTFVTSTAIVLSLWRSLLEAQGTLKAAYRIYESALRGILNCSLVIFNQIPIGSINNRLSTDQSYVDYSIFRRFSQAVSTIIFTTLTAISLCYLSKWSVPLMPLLAITSYLYVFKNYIPMCMENMRAILESRSALCSILSQSINGSLVIRASKREEFTMSQFLKYLNIHQNTKFFAHAAASWTIIRLRIVAYPLVVINMMVPIIPLIYTFFKTGEIVSDNENVVSAEIGLALAYSFRFAKLLKATLSRTVELESEMCASQRLQELAKLNPKYRNKKRAINSSSVENEDVRGIKGIQLVDATVDYNSEDLMVGDDFSKNSLISVNLRTKPCEQIGIIGRTGAGKSTLLLTLAGLLPLSRGKMMIDGKNLEDIAEEELALIVGNIPHTPPLLAGWTIRNYVDPYGKYSDELIWNALDVCTIRDYIRSLSESNQLSIEIRKNWQSLCVDTTQKQEDSVIISEAHLQYLNLARLYLELDNLRVVLVDESTFVVEDENNTLVPINVLLKKYFTTCIVFIVAHHTESLSLCDRVIILDQGRIVGECKPSDVSSQGLLAKICSEHSTVN